MTLLSSKRQSTVNNSHITSTHRIQTYNSQWRNQIKMGLFPFLDTKVTPGPNNTLITTVNRKSTHTDQYLHWDSTHFISAKHSVYKTLAHRAKVVSSNQASLTKELEHIRMALNACHFPTLALNRLQYNIFSAGITTTYEPSSTDSQHNNNDNYNGTSNNNSKNISMVVPYIQGLGEKFKRTCNGKGIQVHFKGSDTTRTLLMAPKDKDTKLQKSGVIYKYKCPQMNCPEECIGETGGAFGDRLKEYVRTPSPSTNMPVPQDIQSALNASALFTWRHKAQPETSKKICSWGTMTLI